MKYDTYFSEFRDWCLKHSNVHLRASVLTVALLMEGLVQQRVSTSVLEVYFYSLSWTHEFSWSSNPCGDKFLKLVLTGGNRSYVIKTYQQIATYQHRYTTSVNGFLFQRSCKWRSFVMCLFGFSGFFQFSELSNIRMCDIKWENAYIEIHIPLSYNWYL